MTNRGLGARAQFLKRILLAIVVVAAAGSAALRADEPYARSRTYDLQHSRIALRFDLDQRKVLGDVTHSLEILRNDTSSVWFDSSGLTIQSVTVNKESAKFESADDKLTVQLPHSAKSGERFEIEIRYEGKPTKGLYFILPDKSYPARPAQVWTQGESQDTHYYLPTYDYPNNRLTTETILTVPETWITVANGRLISVSKPAAGVKTWTWRESQPSSTYLITAVAGEFDEVKDAWRGRPVTYYAPKGRGDRLAVNYGRTPQMLELFSNTLGVEYPWEKYAQSMVDDFVAGGMENSSATTNTSSSLRSPKLAREYLENEDPLISHELGHQWFGDLVTCKDWGNIWLNEGFATFMETIWGEHQFGQEEADYDRWDASREWFGQHDLYKLPIVRHDFSDTSEFNGNAYTKGGWVLDMLRYQLGKEEFYAGLKHYLEANRGRNVVTADLAKAFEQATHTNVDQFMNEWVYGAGAPEFDLSYTYDSAKKLVRLNVKQTQTVEGRVGIFTVPVNVEVTTAEGSKTYPIEVSKVEETFTFPVDSAPLMVLFDKGDHVLKTAKFQKDEKEWLYQAKNASEVPDRADALVALGKLKDDTAIAALGEALRTDKFWGVRATAAKTLSEIGTPAAAAQLLGGVDTAKEPWLRAEAVTALGGIKDNKEVAAKLIAIGGNDASLRARAAALQAVGKVKAPGAFELLERSVRGESPDDFLRNAALRSFGPLGDDKAVPLLKEWARAGKPIDSRVAAVASMAQLQKDDKALTQEIASYLQDPNFLVKFRTVFALGGRGDASAIPALEAMLKRPDLSIEMAPMINGQIERLKHGKGMAEGEAASTGEEPLKNVPQQLQRLERMMEEMNERLKKIESRLPEPKK
jgi:aminopeptidase N